MQISVLDDNFEVVDLLDNFTSLIWTDRYDQYGDFEIYAQSDISLIGRIKPDSYLMLDESEHVMIVEDINISSDSEYGSTINITGRSVESILDRRIVWKQTLLNGKVQDCVERLLNENAISPEDPKRKIPTLIFKRSDDPAIDAMSMEAQYTGDNLYDAIRDICVTFELGFKITISEDDKFVFELYSGVDRSYEQTENLFVVFSPKFDNLTNSNFYSSKSNLRTTALVGGEGEGANRIMMIVDLLEDPNPGLNRRELFVDARDISTTTSEGQLPPEEYAQQLAHRGFEQLYSNSVVTTFEGQAETSVMFTYGKDFFMGDIVQIENEYGLTSRSRITELVHSQSSSEISVYPTFTTVE